MVLNEQGSIVPYSQCIMSVSRQFTRTHTLFWTPVWMNYNVSIELEVKRATDFLPRILEIITLSTVYIQQSCCSQSHLTELFCKLHFTGEVTPHILFSKLFKLIMTSVKLCITLLFSVSGKKDALLEILLCTCSEKK